MQFNILAPIQALLKPKNQFALFVVSYFTAKVIHLSSHAGSLPIVLYVLYLPTFLLQDLLLLVFSKLVVYTQYGGGQPSATRKAIGGLLAYVFVVSCTTSAHLV